MSAWGLWWMWVFVAGRVVKNQILEGKVSRRNQWNRWGRTNRTVLWWPRNCPKVYLALLFLSFLNPGGAWVSFCVRCFCPGKEQRPFCLLTFSLESRRHPCEQFWADFAVSSSEQGPLVILVCITPTQSRKCRRYIITFAQRLIHPVDGVCWGHISHQYLVPDPGSCSSSCCVLLKPSDRFSSVQSLSCVWLFLTPWITAHRPPCPSPTLKPMSIELVMPSNHLILCHPLLLLPSISQHQGLFKWVSSSHQVVKILEFQFQHQSFQWKPRTAFL